MRQIKFIGPRYQKQVSVLGKQIVKTCMVLGLLGVLVFMLARPITLATADLGRHLKNGQLIVEQLQRGHGFSSVLFKNTYSYTNPEFSSLNHHWGSGVIFYYWQEWFGFGGLSVLYIGGMLLSFSLVLLLAYKKCGLWTTFMIGALCIPLLAYRYEVRPEVFSYVLVAVFMYLLDKYANREGFINLWLLLPLQVLWVNLHIYFFLGFALVAAYLFGAILKKDRLLVLKYVYLEIALLIASLVSPLGLSGLLYPFTIFSNYAYRVLENQTPWFLQNLGFSQMVFWLLEILPVLVLFGFIYELRKGRNVNLPTYFTALGGMLLGLFAVRNSALSALLCLPALAHGLNVFWSNRKIWWLQSVQVKLAVGLLVVFLLAVFAVPEYKSQAHGIGIEQDSLRAGNFIRQTGVEGPIFNNYDSGGYLIYNLYPKVPVFVDNRPESYPGEFFSDVYIPMQEQEREWQIKLKQYNFNAIVFNWHDVTPWAQTFLARIIIDSLWAPVYVDNYMLVLLRRGGANQNIIENYELPKSMFQFR